MGSLVSQYIPAPVRRVMYAVLGSLVALEVIWDVVPEPLEGKLLASLSALGLGVAFTQTRD